MINFRDITTAIETLINNANTDNRAYAITRNEPVNTDMGRAVVGWCGIYRDRIEYDPHSTGTSPYLADVHVRIEVQVASMVSAADCEERMDDFIEFILGAVSADRTWGGTVGQALGFEIDYDDNFNTSLENAEQFATITLKGQVKA